jgi:hypothetical protein
VRLGQLARRHAHKAQRLLGDTPITVLHLDLAHHPWPLPVARRFRLGPPRFFSQQRSGGLLLPPRFELLAYSTGARDEGHSAKALLQTQPEGSATLRLPIGDNPAAPCQSPGQPFRKRYRCCHTITALAIPDAQAPRDAIALEGFEGNGTKDLGEIGRQQGIQNVPEPVIMQRDPREPRLQQRHHPTLFQPLPDFLEGMIAIQHREHQGFHSPPSREPRRRVGREKAVDHCGDVQAPQDAQD